MISEDTDPDGNRTYGTYDDRLDYRTRDYEDYYDRRDTSEEERFDPAERIEATAQVPQVMTMEVALRTLRQKPDTSFRGR